MATYECWVRVPISQNSSSKRPVKVQVTANNISDALAILRSQHGADNVVGAPIKIND